jgi:fibronectin-binding autotransporter adhesin
MKYIFFAVAFALFFDDLKAQYIPVTFWRSQTGVASTYNWDATVGNGSIQDGPGTWDLNSTNFTANLGASNVTLPMKSNVIFGGGSSGTAGTVSVNGNWSIGDLTFNNPSAGTYTLSGSGSLLFNLGAVITNNTDSTISKIIAGGNRFVKSGTGSLTLSGANTNTGGVLISQGSLILGSAAGAGTGTISMGNSNTGANAISLSIPTALTIANPVILNNLGTGTASIVGSSNARINGAITVNRALNISTVSGTFRLSAVSGSGSLNISGAGTTFGNGVISGISSITISSGSIFTYQPPNAYSTFNVPTININGTAVYNNVSNARSSGTHNFNSVGGGTINMGNNTLNSAPNVFNTNGGNTNTIAGSWNLFTTAGNALTFNVAPATSGFGLVFSCVANNGTPPVTKTGAGSMNVTGTLFASGFTISQGILQVGNGGTAGTLHATAPIVNNSSLIYNLSSNVTLANLMSGTGSFTKLGTGTVTLTAANSYSGATTVSSGTLAVQGIQTGGSAVTVASGAGISGGTAVTGRLGGSLTFSDLSSKLTVNAITTTSASKLTCANLSAPSGFTINVAGAMNAGTYPILDSSSGTPTPTLGTNTSGRSVSFNWVGQTLNMTLL